VSAVFVDRERELEALGVALAAPPSVVIVEGEAGIGKTTLIERFAGSLAEVRVLRAGGDESETDIPFAAADQLLRSAGSDTDALRDGQHVAVGLELLELMTATPSVVIVDDAHLIDAESLRALLFAARRLATGRAVLILAVRGSAAATLAEGWLGLATVSIQTAAGSANPEVTIDGVLEAEALRDFLYTKMRGVREHAPDHAADHATPQPATASAANAEGDEALALLSDIRDALRRLEGRIGTPGGGA